jgi:hypothetical protein
LDPERKIKLIQITATRNAGQAAMGIGAQLRRQSIDSTVRPRKS